MDACGIGVQFPAATETFLRDFQTRALRSLPYIMYQCLLAKRCFGLGVKTCPIGHCDVLLDNTQ
jgi:hypothetical protein